MNLSRVMTLTIRACAECRSQFVQPIVVGNNRNACVRVPVSEKCDLFECDVKIIAGMDNKIEREVKCGFAWAQIIGAGYRSQDAKIRRAQYFSKPLPEQYAFSNENDRKGTLPTHGAVSNPA
jgi:hypothetical protein